MKTWRAGYAESVVRVAIRSAVVELSALGYDWDGDCNLPIRPDVAHYVQCHFSSVANGANLDRLPIPTLALELDGTVTITFKQGGRTLGLEFPCPDVVVYAQVFRGKAASVSGTIRVPDHSGPGRFREVDELFDWLMGRVEK